MVEVVTTSDHAILWASLCGKNHGLPRNNGFRYETSWVVGREYHQVCTRAWNDALGQGDIWNRIGQKLSKCKNELLRWKMMTCGKIRITIKNLQYRLNGAYDSFDDQARSEIKNIKRELESLLAQDDERWKQRAKVNWLKHGDRNTKFYHAIANQRRRNNRIF